MANCPKCGKKLRIYHWRPECPFCGVNMVYYNSNDRLLEETERSEIEHAHTQPQIDRIKAATIGSPLAIVRLVLSLIPLGGLFLPLARFSFAAPFVSRSGGVNMISVYNVLTKTDFRALTAALGSSLLGPALRFYVVSLLCLLLSAVGVLVHTFLQTLACSPKGKQRNIGINVVNLLTAVISIVCFMQFASRIRALLPSVIGTTGIAFGAFVYLGLLALSFAADLFCIVMGVPVRYTVCLIGGLPSDEYFAMKEQGVSDLEIRKKMVEALTVMQEEARAKEAEAEAEALQKRAAHK